MGQNTATFLAAYMELPSSKRKASQKGSNASAREELKRASPPLYINTHALHKDEGLFKHQSCLRGTMFWQWSEPSSDGEN